MTDLPEHALAEIAAAKGKEKAELKNFWESWAAVGDAKLEAAEAVRSWGDTERTYAECRARANAKASGSLPPMACDCGKCAKNLTAAGKAVVKARDKVERSITKHKAA